MIPNNVHHARADRGAAREPDRPGFAAALRRARRHPGAAGRARGADRRTSSRRASTATTVVRVERMLNLAEYKRRQAAPGVKVTLRNFGRDRRYPITNRFRDPGTPLPQPDLTLLAARRGAEQRGVRFVAEQASERQKLQRFLIGWIGPPSLVMAELYPGHLDK